MKKKNIKQNVNKKEFPKSRSIQILKQAKGSIKSKSKVIDCSEKFAVIGAGPMGLAVARNFQKFDIPFDGFEKHSSVGGLWDIENPHSTVYESAHLISSKKRTEFTEYPMGDDVPDYPSHRELIKYFQSFADHFKLNDYYYFNETIDRIEPDLETSLWFVKLKSGKKFLYKGIILASGTLHEPNIPNIPGKFSGKILHSAEYKSADIFANKKVLIVGAGNSGCDIAVDAVHRAKTVSISLRRGYHFVPKYVFGKPADTIGGLIKLPAFAKQLIDGFLLKWFTGDPVRFGFPKPDHKIYESHPIVNSLVLYHAGHGDIQVTTDIRSFDGKKVVFIDGTSQEYDLILYATGYKLHYPFIDKDILDWKGSMPDFYMNTFSRRFPGLVIAGMIEAAGIGWQGRYDQAELIARYIRNWNSDTLAYRDYRKSIQNDYPDLSGGFSYVKLDRMSYYVHKNTFLKKIKEQSSYLTI
ncbi:flavin-containing monooxygenase [Leptospira sp. GIMC2001]|uniref:flavin-containing monooxygenase n=1 Tax=Leptospira sp. GIMC2001 TaxID=1513297 RepID=UPI002349E0C0|nr:NAD(P)/FAD-dependent oxidoreductase [Leptospira sp. GIMC2001]WCL50596.1 NAD(P)/FAD-dependent oxidoreductase [Leptospira sp. GIMC2001]